MWRGGEKEEGVQVCMYERKFGADYVMHQMYIVYK